MSGEVEEEVLGRITVSLVRPYCTLSARDLGAWGVQLHPLVVWIHEDRWKVQARSGSSL